MARDHTTKLLDDLTEKIELLEKEPEQLNEFAE